MSKVVSHHEKYIHQLTKGLNPKLLQSFLPTRSMGDLKMIRRATVKCREYIHLWGDMMKDIEKKLDKFVPQIPEKSDRIAVIVEPRKHQDLLNVLRIYMYCLSGWKLQIWCGNDNIDWIKEKLSSWQNVVYSKLPVKNLTVPDYSRLLKSADFWNRIDGEHVLIFQTDSLILRQGIEKFLQYDYVGAPWKVSKEHTLDVGNGGLSLRRKSAMLKIIDKYPDQTGHPEDLYFCRHLKDDGYCLPSREIAKCFSVETVSYDTPIGIHKPLRISINKLKKILSGTVLDQIK